jgi:hypothetical protein
LLNFVDLERSRSEEKVVIVLEGEEALRSDEPGRDLPALLLLFLGLRAAHLSVLLTLLLQRQARHMEDSSTILTEERQDCVLGYVKGFLRVE